MRDSYFRVIDVADLHKIIVHRCSRNFLNIRQFRNSISWIFINHGLDYFRNRSGSTATAFFIFQMKITSSKHIKPIPKCLNTGSTTPIHTAHFIYGILSTDAFLKTMKRYMLEMYSLIFHI